MNAQIVGVGEFFQTGNLAESGVNFLPAYKDNQSMLLLPAAN